MEEWLSQPIIAGVIANATSFRDEFGGIYEDSPWIADETWEQIKNSARVTFGDLAAAMERVVEQAPEADKLALLRAHPELAGRAALAGELTENSAKEQAGAGLDACSPAELAKITHLNAAYGAKFCFPFIIAVAGLSPSDIIAAMERRCDGEPAGERKEAILQVHSIAKIRLKKLAAMQRENAA